MVAEYVRVLCDGSDTAGMELDAEANLPLWMTLYCLLRCGCDRDAILAYRDDILRHGGSVGPDVLRILLLFVECSLPRGFTCSTLHRRGTAEPVADLVAVTSRIRGVFHRLTGAGCTDMYKCGNRGDFSHRLFLFSLLCNETPYAVNNVIDPKSGEICIPQQEVLRTLQDWLWHKLFVVCRMPEIGPITRSEPDVPGAAERGGL